jgi:hypothetical protein
MLGMLEITEEPRKGLARIDHDFDREDAKRR